jgi:hypothetical protein
MTTILAADLDHESQKPKGRGSACDKITIDRTVRSMVILEDQNSAFPLASPGCAGL